ncbi:hypothetical protein J8I26_14320 [Herbaspirillum sp. LeCh32-8]|uniref:hypothetical protein n=1 Tax=Herbaspirillum sp. LeCh32-8 TaxID=2821356 RepID=UPI001AE3C1ED|nr:hypothetical protein [Herbaspirillum sp. LeCh32-8]MBP0599292.1 hypothetical protein [Herbaspirillum sp. LeCh32-8]
MRRALDWLVVDEGGHAAGVVPFTGAGMMSADARSIPEMCARMLDSLRRRPMLETRGDADSAAAGAGDAAPGVGTD